MPRVMQRSQLSKSVTESKAGDSPGSDQPLRMASARRFPSGVRAGIKPFDGSTMRVVCRCGVLGSVTPERSALPYSPFSISCRPRSPRPEAAAMRCLCSSSVHHALFMSQGGPPNRVALAHRSSGMPAACIMFKFAWMSGSPHGVFGWTQPFGVSMKWLASLGGPRIDWPCGATTKIGAAAAPSSATSIVGMIRCIVTPREARSNLTYPGVIFIQRSMVMRRLGRLVVLASSLFAAAVAGQAGPRPYTTWTAYSGGADSSQYSALDQINKSNVSQLHVAWTFPVTGTIIFNPLVVGRVMYLQASGNSLAAVDAATGKEIWRRQTQGPLGARGMNYWESPDRADRRRLFIAGGFLTAIKAQSGDLIAGFGDNGRVDLRIALQRQAAQPLHTGNPGRIFEGTMIVSLPAQGASYDATPADVQAYDVRTGRIQWVFHSIPHPGEFGYDTWPPEAYKNSGGVHNWSESTVDERRGIAFISFGSPRFDFYGGDRPGNNLFGNSLVALDARTGTRIWHYQLVHHDLWDYDLPQAAKLLTIRQNGRAIDVVAQATKHGFLFVFERETGRPIWPIEERRVSASDVPGEHASPTQPFPTRPAPFARQTFGEKDINPYLPPAEREALVQRV